MFKKKHQQNQTEIKTESQNNATNESQQNEQTDATNPQEHGRSMTEMLGVLAIIGILSIGGIQGYRYAMNKYHANEVVNELNIVNAQLAIFMNGIHDDEAVMSLGEPYDDGEKINAGGYTFAYGCGQDPASTSPCDLDETGYYMTLDGIPEDVCKSASQMTSNMMNLVEQRVNGQIDSDGILCQDENNQLTFLFDANAGEGFEDGNGGEEVTNPDNPNVTNPYEEETTQIYNPDTTKPYEEETTTWIETTSVVECGDGYFKMNGSCYSCDQQKPYYGVDLYREELKKCTNRSLVCGTTCSVICDSYLNTCPDGYVLIPNKTSCSSSGFAALDISATEDMWTDIVCDQPNACCEPEGSVETTIAYETTTIFETTPYVEETTTTFETTPYIEETTPYVEEETTTIFETTTHVEEETTMYETTTLNCEPSCRWTGWLDSGKPDYTKAGRDVESLENICVKGYVDNIQCRAAMFPNTPLDELTQVVTCNKEVGLICKNSEQTTGGAIPMPYCVNYEIKVYCCEIPAGCE